MDKSGMAQTNSNTTNWLILMKVLVKVALAITITVIALGAYTRLADAGLGCPDWPGCYGQLIVPSGDDAVRAAEAKYPERPVEAHKAWLEMIHRYAASTLGLFIVAIGFIGYKLGGTIKITALTAVGLVLLQGALGAWTVTLKLMPIIVMLHLLGGFTIFTVLVLLHNQLSRQQANASMKTTTSSSAAKIVDAVVAYSKLRQLKQLAWLCLVVLVVQIMLGGWTSSNYAALMCTSLPICNGDWFQYLDFKNAFDFIQLGFDNYEFGVLEYPARMTIHVSHRIGAIVTAIVFAIFVFRLLRFANAHKQSSVGVLAIGLMMLLILQIALGVINVVMSLPLLNAVAHNVVASLLLITTVSTIYKLGSLSWQLSQVLPTHTKSPHDGAKPANLKSKEATHG